MNPKLKRVLSIIALVCMGLFVILLPIWLIWPKVFGVFTAAITFFFFFVAMFIFLIIYFTRGFPSQQLKDAERKKIKEEYLRSLEKEKESKQSKDMDGRNPDNDEVLKNGETSKSGTGSETENKD